MRSGRPRVACAVLTALVVLAPAAPLVAREHVILLHGLSRQAGSMEPMAKALREDGGYWTLNVGYPSSKKDIRALADEHVAPAVERCRKNGATRIHFVTHSMGGILVRDYLARTKPRELGRVVMLAPPNQGSEVVDRIGHWPAYRQLTGPAGQQLGTRKNASYPRSLPAIDFPCGIIAGSRTINWINSGMIEGRDDGKVSIESTKAKGMTDHIVGPRTHPMIMRSKDSKALTIRFLKQGRFR